MDSHVAKGWKNWGDHPVIVAIGTIVAILGLIVTLREWIGSRKQTPDEFIRQYYQALNDHQYDTAWTKLSDGFKTKRLCCNPDGSYKFRDYISWWDGFSEVKILRLEVLEIRENSATVKALIRYYPVDTSKTLPDQEHILLLVADKSNSGWVINESSRKTVF